MAHHGHPAESADNGTASPRGGYRPSRGFLLGMMGVFFLAGVLAAAGAIAAAREPQPESAPQAPPPPVEVTTVPRPVTPEPDLTQNISSPGSLVAVADAADAASSSAGVSPSAVASSWSMAPAFVPPAPAPAISPSASWLAEQAASLYGIDIALEGQDWGDDEAAQTANIGAVISAMDMLPVTVSSSIAANPAGPLVVLSNVQGRTQDGWQPYGDTQISFYTNSDQGASGYHASNQVVLAKGAGMMAVAHEILHAYQFRNASAGEYILALLGDEMKSFMAATGWRQTVSDDDLRAASHASWDDIAGLFVYEGQPLTCTDEAGRTISLDAPNPVEAFAMAGAIYYGRPTGTALPGWPEYWDWFRTNLG